MKYLIRNVLLALLILIPLKSFSASVWCNGTIKHTYVDFDGTLYINGTWRNEHTAVCNLNMPRLGVSVETCNAWLSIAMAAKLSKTKVVTHYADIPSCLEIPQYGQAPKPSYLMLSE